MVQQRRRVPRRPYGTGNKELDAKILELIESSSPVQDADLVREMVSTCFRLARDRSHRGEMKLVNGALKEFAYAFRVFKAYRGARKVSIFGSARSGPDDPNYEVARQFGMAMAKRGWMVITGAGPGIMTAGHLGAGAERSFGANIRLPIEADPNEVIEGDPKLINFKYFFTRKVTFLKESDAFVLFPGGFGTLDEAFELLTLMQTGKSDLHPIVLMEASGSDYWEDWQRFVDRCLGGRGLISSQDTNLYCVTDSAEQAVQEIEGFYRNYQSERYVDGMLVLRVRRLPGEPDLRDLTHEFPDILDERGLRVVGPSPQEVAENDALDLGRIAVGFNQREYGRLRRLIDALNRF